MTMGAHSYLLPSERLLLIEKEASQAHADYIAASSAVDSARSAGGEALAQARKVRAAAYVYRANANTRAATAKKNLQPDVNPEITQAIVLDSALPGDQCIEWSGLTNRNDYGYARLRGVRQLAHRLSYIAARSLDIEAIAGVVIRHQCDNPKCIRPSHLVPGTQADNVRDMYERGRAVNNTARGSNSGTSKLHEADIKAIRLRLASGERRSKVAADFAIGKTQIARIARRESWAHV